MERNGLIEEMEGSIDVMKEKFPPVDQMETSQPKKLGGGHSQAWRSIADKPTRSDHNDKNVFISHSGKQKSFARHLYRDLTNRGVSCFFDEDHGSLPVGGDFPSCIFEAIKTCNVAVILFSKDFLESKWPMLELSAFVEARDRMHTNPNLKILPLFFQISPDALKYMKADNEKWKQLKLTGAQRTEWLQALKAMWQINGINFREGDDEVEFREKIVKETLCLLSPSQMYQGEGRMCQEVTDFLNNVRPNEKGIRTVGLYGLAGMGKTSLVKAFCNLKMKEFEGKVCHLEFSRGDRDYSFERRKLALQYLTHCAQSYIQTLTEDQAEVEFYTRLKGQRVLLVLDNITEESIDEVRDYIQASLSENSYILLSSRSKDLLLKRFEIDPQSCMHVPTLTEEEAIAILLGITSPEVSRLGAEDKDCALKCANRCSFRGRTYHPLALKAFGRHLSSKYRWNLSKWVAEIDGLVDRCGYGLDDVFDVLGKAFDDMGPKYRTIFMLLTIYTLPNMSPHKLTEWLAIICNEEISFANKAVEDLCKEGFIEEFEPQIRIHDVYLLFAQNRANEMRRWLWWKGDRSSTRGLISKDQEGFELVRLEQCKYRRPSQIPLKHLQNLLLLQLVGVQNMSKLDLAPMYSLRSITLHNCQDLIAIEGMENLVQLAWLQISKVNPMFELPELSSLQALQHLEIDIAVLQQLGDLTPCFHLREIKVRCPSLSAFPRLNGLPYLEKVEFSAFGEVKGPLDCTDCEMLQSIVLSGSRKIAASPVVAGCKKLNKLVLSDCDAVTAFPDTDVAGDEPSALKTPELFISSKTA